MTLPRRENTNLHHSKRFDFSMKNPEPHIPIPKPHRCRLEAAFSADDASKAAAAAAAAAAEAGDGGGAAGGWSGEQAPKAQADDYDPAVAGEEEEAAPGVEAGTGEEEEKPVVYEQTSSFWGKKGKESHAVTVSRHLTPTTAVQQGGNTKKVLKMILLQMAQAKARIWPRLSFWCRLRPHHF